MGAGEGFLSCVQSHVDLDVVVPAETLAADLALEWFLSSVDQSCLANFDGGLWISCRHLTLIFKVSLQSEEL